MDIFDSSKILYNKDSQSLRAKQHEQHHWFGCNEATECQEKVLGVLDPTIFLHGWVILRRNASPARNEELQHEYSAIKYNRLLLALLMNFSLSNLLGQENVTCPQIDGVIPSLFTLYQLVQTTWCVGLNLSKIVSPSFV